MPPRKKVHTLQAFARDKVLYHVCAVILNEIYCSEDENWDVFGPPQLSEKLDQVKHILSESLTPGILEEMLNSILSQDHDIEVIIKYIALQLLLVNGVRTLKIGNFPESYYSLVLEAIAQYGESLHTLDLRGLWVKNQHKNALLKILRKLWEIRRITLRYNCDDEILATLGKYSSNLQKIDISGSKNISENGLKNLCSNPHRICITKMQHTLKIVDLGGPGAQDIPPNTLKYLLFSLDNLVSLGSYEKTGQAVELFYERYPGKKLGLLYMHDYATSSMRFDYIAKVCPNLQAIYLDSPKGPVLQNLDMLPKLTELKLHKVRWSDTEVMFKKIGPNLNSLYLLSVFGDIDMINLGSWCPGLHRLEFHNVSLVSNDSRNGTAFNRVREFLLYSSQASTMCIKLILNQCIAVERLSLGDCGMIDDNSIKTCLSDNSLQNVKEMWLGAAQFLTVRSVEALIDHCPKLTDLGNLANWSIHPDDMDILRVEFLVDNIDLTLHELAEPDPEEWIAFPLDQ